MESLSEREIAIELSVRADQSELLEGLEAWQQLGLLSDVQLRQLARSYLTCPLPQTVEAEDATDSDFIVVPPDQPAPRARRSLRQAARSPRQAAPLVPQMVRSLMAEVSVVWLLFLGVFLVVVSSGVLAATQWQNFSPIGQYAILFGYTIAFWIAAEWTGKQQTLHLTSRMLQITTLLIIPVNFWMIDGFQLWQAGLGWGVAAIAGASLSALILRLLRSSPRLMQANSLGLSWLHWGWVLAGFPLIATYLGTIGTAGLQLRQPERRQGDVSSLAIAFSTLLLIARAVFQADVPLSQIGLAVGISGWLLVWLNRRENRPLWTEAGAILLLFAWGVTVIPDPPWQAISVSALGLWLLGDRLRQTWQGPTLFAMFLVGLQAYGLLWRVLPIPLRQATIALATQLAGPNVQPWHFIGLGLFPYLVLTVLLASRLRHEHPNLATTAERIALGLGLLLAIASCSHPWTRSLDLTLSVLLLAVTLRSRFTSVGIYLTHTTGLLALFSWIDWRFPTLGAFGWAVTLLATMAAEWGFLVWLSNPPWQRSAWHLGLVLAGLSYPLVVTESMTDRALVWLIVPALLTLLAYTSKVDPPQLASRFSIVALLVAQALTIGNVTPFFLSTAAATVLMLLNTRQLADRLAAAVTVGFGLACFGAGVRQFLGDIPTEAIPTWLAIALVGLWLLRFWALRRTAQLYVPALDGWAIALSLLTLGWLTLALLDSDPPGQLLLAAGLVTGALLIRIAQSATEAGFYSIAWSSELAIVALLRLLNAPPDAETIATLALGLLTQVGGDLWVRRTGAAYRSSWHVIPLLFAVLGIGLAHRSFTAVTGLYTFAAALTLMGVGRRQSWLSPITYLGIVGSSIAAYELLIYQLMQQPAGAPGDGLTLLAALAATIAIVDRLATRWLLAVWRLTLPGLLTISHLHWLGASVLALGAILVPLSNTGSSIWIAVMLTLAAYASWQGRTTPVWIYAGVGHAWLALCYLLYRTLPDALFWSWIAAIAALVAVGLYYLPWGRWGWVIRPWQRSAALLPGIMTLLTAETIALAPLWLVAGFYAWLSIVERRVRLSYLSLLLADWGLLRLFSDRNVTEPLWYMALLSGSLLFVAQVDPLLRSPTAKETRHWLRSFATGLFSLTALYQSDASWVQGLLTIGLAIGMIFAGLALRIRAFLYVGTATFMIKVLRQLWLFVNNYSLLLWALGILLGLLFIWIAATFEARRTQVGAIVQYWLAELEQWD